MVGVVQRHQPKTFRPLTMQAGQWRTKSSEQLKGTPYRLPAVVVAVDQGDPVWVVEGERDADTLAREGIAATCNAGGADKWTDAHSRWLTGAHVTVCADVDGPGRRHAAAVVASLTEVAASVRLVEPAEGCKDITEHVAAGHSLHAVRELPLLELDAAGAPVRRLRSTPASAVVTRRLRWLWSLRILLGGLTLLAGREGLGKSTVAVDLTARVTRGVLEGEMYGQPRNVIYVDSEDARDYTIVPRLTAAGADLDRVIFLDALTSEDQQTGMVLPLDTELLALAVSKHGAVLVVLDAATSVIDSRLDGDKDRQMRQALEAIARNVGERTGCAVLGIVHFGKRDSNDTGKLILGSIAWSQVTRSTLAVARDDDSGNLVLSATKANLSPGDTPSLAARIVSHRVETSDGVTSVGRIEWLGETDRNARDLLGGFESDEERSEQDEAKQWLLSYLQAEGGTVPAADVLKAATRDGIAKTTLHRARRKAGVTTAKSGMQGGWTWSHPDNKPPEDSTKVPKIPVHENVNSSEPSWNLRSPEEPSPGDSNTTTVCVGCGQPLLLRLAGRDHCDVCRIKGEAS